MAGRSLLEWNLRWLIAAGMTPIWINLHYRAKEVRRAVESMEVAGADIRFSSEDPILGTAGAWRKLEAEWGDTCLVVYGDNLARFDLAAFAATHGAAVRSPEASARDPATVTGPDPAPRGVLATLALYDSTRHTSTGIAGSSVVVADGLVERFQEVRGGVAGPSLVNTGVYLLEPALAEQIEPGFSDFGAHIFPVLVRDRALAAYVIEEGGFCLGLDTPEHFRIGTDMVQRGTVRLE